MKIGTSVIITNHDKLYRNYNSMASLMQLTNWRESEDLNTNLIYKVICLKYHETKDKDNVNVNRILAGIENKYGEQYIIGIEGIKSIKKWWIRATKETFQVLENWRRSKLTNNDYINKPTGSIDKIKYLSEHWYDSSYYARTNDIPMNYTEITFQQFLEITNNDIAAKEAFNKYIKDHTGITHDNVSLADAFCAGARWQRNQIIKK